MSPGAAAPPLPATPSIPPADPAAPLRGLACLVLAHDNAAQLALLLGWLHRHGASCHLHLDRRAAATRQELTASLSPEACAILPAEKSWKVEWGGYAMVGATLDLMRAALRPAPGRQAPRALVLLSGAHLPVQPAAAIAARLLDGRQHVDLRLSAAEPVEHKALHRFWFHALPGREEQRPLLRWLNRNNWRLGKADLARGLRGMTPMVGAQWWCLSADCARHLLGFIDANPWYPRFFRWRSIPDESFFHTLVGASAYAEGIAEAPIFQRMIGYSPRLITIDDLPEAVASGMPFARKFDLRHDPAAVEAALALAETGRLPAPLAAV